MAAKNLHAAQYTAEYSDTLDRASMRPDRSARFAAGQYVTLVKSKPHHVMKRRNGWVVVPYNKRIKDGKVYASFGEAMRATQPNFDGTLTGEE
jgi:hypothetical protein